jgi:hypothetical protein
MMKITKTLALVRIVGRAIAKVVSRWLPTVVAQVCVRAGHVGFVVAIAALGQVFFEYFDSPANHHSTNFSITITTRGWQNTPIGGCSAERTQLDSNSHYIN